jgi:hypothetical protein
MSDFLGSAPARPRPQPDQAGTLEMLASLFLVAFVVATLYVGRQIFIPIAIAILVSFVLSPPILLLRRWGLSRVPSVVTVVLAALAIAFSVSGFQGAEPTGLPPQSTHWCRHGLAEPEPPIKGLAPRFAGLGTPPATCATAPASRAATLMMAGNCS